MAKSAEAVEYTDCSGVRFPNKCPRYDTKQSDGEDPVLLELWGMQSTPSLPRVVAPDKVLSMGQTEQFNI